MKLGTDTAVLHDRPLVAALATIRSLGLQGAEINAGEFLSTPHLPVNELFDGRLDAAEHLSVFDAGSVELTGPNQLEGLQIAAKTRCTAGQLAAQLV